MQAIEMAIWSAMAGVLLTLGVVATFDMAARPTLAALRAWVSVLLTGWICLLMTGLPEALWPAWRDIDWLPVKATVGPLCGALVMNYLGYWSGLQRDDELVRRMMEPGAMLLVVGTFGLLGMVLAGSGAETVLPLTAAVNGIAVLMGMVIAVRSVTLGDAMARWMVGACLCLAQMTAGLYAKGLGMHMGHAYWALTACSTVGYFVIVVVLVRGRNREFRRLRRQALGQAPALDAPALPCGAALVARIEDALWRSMRLERPCVVAAVSVSNLYAYREGSVPDPVPDILVTLAARIRQRVGFRNVVGLHHQRCFVLAMSAVQDPKRAELVADRLLRELRMAVNVGTDPLNLPFQPEVAIGVVRVPTGCAESSAIRIINLAEQLALQALEEPHRVLYQAWVERAPTPMAVMIRRIEEQPGTA